MSEHGGKRENSGRPPGRQPGFTVPGRELRVHARRLLSDLIGTEDDPLLIAIAIARDVKQPAALRLEAALGTVKYIYPTLAASHVLTENIHVNVSEALEKLTAELENYEPPPPPTLDAKPDVQGLQLDWEGGAESLDAAIAAHEVDPAEAFLAELLAETEGG